MTDSENPFLKQIRNRPTMYIGATGQQGSAFLVGELVSNSIDQFLMGYGTSVNLQIAGRSITVTDDGVGLPFDLPSNSKNKNRFADHMTELHRHPTADNHAPHVHIHSSSGHGLIVVNALSQSVEVRSWRAGKLWQQAFGRGVTKSEAKQIQPSDLPANSLLKDRGTEITFVPDHQILGEAPFDLLNFRKRMFDAAHLFAGLKVGLQDEVFYAPEGLAALAATNFMNGIGRGEPLHLKLDAKNYKFELVAWGRAGNTNSRTENAKRKTKWASWANGWDTSQGGTHIDACNTAFDEVKWKPKRALVQLLMKEPEFAGPTKQKLNVPHIEKELVKCLRTKVQEYCESKKQGKFCKHFRET